MNKQEVIRWCAEKLTEWPTEPGLTYGVGWLVGSKVGESPDYVEHYASGIRVARVEWLSARKALLKSGAEMSKVKVLMLAPGTCTSWPLFEMPDDSGWGWVSAGRGGRSHLLSTNGETITESEWEAARQPVRTTLTKGEALAWLAENVTEWPKQFVSAPKLPDNHGYALKGWRWTNYSVGSGKGVELYSDKLQQTITESEWREVCQGPGDAPTWNEGRPLVGTECQLSTACEARFRPVRVLFMGDHVCVVEDERHPHKEMSFHLCNCEFRPIKDAREKATTVEEAINDYIQDLNTLIDEGHNVIGIHSVHDDVKHILDEHFSDTE